MDRKRIKSYKSFIDGRINEGLVDWIKEKFSKIGEYFNKLKGKALVSVASSIIPKELLDYIRLQAGVSVSESLMILEEVKHMGMGIGFDDDILSPEELDALSDEEYNEYLQNISDNIVFQTDIKGDIPENDKELYDFLVSKGIEVNKEIVYEHKKSVDNIYRKIDSLNINKYAKKALKYASMIVLFGMVVFKGAGQAYGAETHSDFDAGDKYFADTHLDDGGEGDQVDKNEDPRTLWDKLTGKRVVTSHKKMTGKKFDAAAKRMKTDREGYLKSLEDDGWKLTKFESDTLHDTILKQKADTLVNLDTLAFGIDSDLFLTGKFDLNPNVKSAILSEIGSISEKGGIITNYVIESSTDKEPIQMTNQVLAQNRADAVKDLLVGIGVDDSLVDIKTKPEQGPDVYSKTMTETERNNARLQTQEFRYVLVNIMYYKEGDIKIIPEIKEVITKVKSVYSFEKESIVKSPPSKDFPKAKKTTTFKNTGKGRSNVDKCETFDNRGWLKKIFGKKPFWLEKNLGMKN